MPPNSTATIQALELQAPQQTLRKGKSNRDFLSVAAVNFDSGSLTHPALEHIAHRPWPVPSGPWIMEQTWNDLLFAHWPVEPSMLRPLVPQQLPLDDFDGKCWVAVAPFHMTGVRPRFVPSIPGLSAFPELNVRTYVTVGDKPGVYFFSLDAASRLAVWAARASYRLPYYFAHMEVRDSDGWIDYRSIRTTGDARLRAKYRPRDPVQLRAPGTLEHWLTERYCLYTVARGSVYRAEIHHEQWPLQDAEAHISENTMASAAGIKLQESAPLLHFAKKLQVLIWPLRRLASLELWLAEDPRRARNGTKAG
jgi:uncharacterized protein